jgi:PTS system mannitol-specific IIC component
MCEKNSYVGVILGVLVAAVVSFLISVPILKLTGKDEDIEAAQNKVKDMKAEAKGTKAAAVNKKDVKKIIFACDAGMGSSAMGATVLRKKLKEAGLEHIEVAHAPVSSIPADAQIVVTHQELGERAATSNPNAELVLITNFLGAPEYDALVNSLK